MITFSTAKNGAEICIKDNIALHSNYNPQKEAERFVSAIETQFVPSSIIVTEPALSYAASFLKERFPDSTLCAVRYCKDFKKTDNLWDKIFYYQKGSLKDELFNFFGEEQTGSLLFLSWKPSENAFSDEYASVWKEIKEYLSLSRDVLGTRMYFNKRWNKNALKFAIFLTNAVKAQNLKTSKPIVITASGPSLKQALPVLKKQRDRFYLLAASSSTLPLLENQIKPDAIISTDGGWYAQEHLKKLASNSDIKLFLSSEAYLSNKMLQSSNIIPLSYQDGIEALLLEQAGIVPLKAERNGTVSGTALELALTLTDNDIFFCGLDLCSSKGFQHTQPNELEQDKCIYDTRLSNLESRAAAGSFENESLKIYRNWFSTRPSNVSSRIKRVFGKNCPFSKPLANIQDIDTDSFDSFLLKQETITEEQPSDFQKLLPVEKRIEKIKSYFASLKIKIDDFYNNQIKLKDTPIELELWFKALSLGDFLFLSQRNECMTEKMYKNLSDNLGELEGIIKRYERNIQ